MSHAPRSQARNRSGRPVLRSAGALVAVVAAMSISASIAPLASADPAPRPAPGMAQKDVREAPDGRYIVGLSAAPVALYAGGVDGIAATRSSNGSDLDRTTSAVAQYRDYLDDERAAVLETVPGVTPFYEYDWAYAGFAAEMTFEQAKALAATPGVAGVFPNERFALDTTHTPEFLGISQEGGLWEQAGGPEDAGEGLVIGIVDGGITPESGSFAPLEEPAPIPDGWTGTCDPGDPTDLGGGTIGDEPLQGDQEAQIECDGDVINNKVIGARYYFEGFGDVDTDEFLSPRDVGGHGSHTSSTSAGNYDVPITVAGADLGSISGMAPRARIATYKACWQTAAGGSCASSDTTMAIDQAVADGVDAINYSIGGSLDSANTPQATAFRAAAAAGIFVATSAGNSGPTQRTVAHNYPWVTTVAASTQDREYRADAVLDDGTTFTGTSISTGAGPAPAVFAKLVPAEGHTAEEAQLCLPETLDTAMVEGKIVVCLRGTNARVEKSQVVHDAGGIGMVLANDGMSGTSTNTERHAVPTVHLAYLPGRDLIDAIGRDEIDPDATIEITEYEMVSGLDVVAPAMASFSSRGPALMAGGDILKPDITAPGVDILASLAPYAPQAGEMYGFQSGTSMSSPHVAGIALLLKDIHPDWSPMAIKSAMITGAYRENNQGDPIMRGSIVATPIDYGAGHVEPQVASATPIVYESGPDEWTQWMCGTHQLPSSDPGCVEHGSIDPSDQNSASIAINDVAGVREVTRTITNVSDADVHASAVVDNPPGLEITVLPDHLVLVPGASATFTVRVEHTDAELDVWQYGAITWDTGDIAVRSPVAVRPASFAATPELATEGSSGTLVDSVTAGVETTIDLTSFGLDQAQVDEAVLTDPEGGSFPPDPPNEPTDPLPSYIMRGVVDVPEGTDLARFELFADDYVENTDLDMYVYLDGTQIESSATGIVNEKVTIYDPAPGEYHVYVELWALANPTEEEAHVYLHSFVVDDEGVGDFTVTPESFETEVGVKQDITYAWSGLQGPPPGGVDAPSTDVYRYMGMARYYDGDTEVANTILRIDVAEGGDPTTPPTTSAPPTTSVPPTTTPVPTTTLPGTGGGDAGLFAGIGIAALLAGGLLVALAARRLRDE